jgi:glycosyltransferase involved in cell wall biosynthesis
LKIVHVVLSLDIGGLERVVLSLVQQAGQLRQDVSVLCIERPGAMAAQFEALGVPVRCIGKKPGLKFSTIGKIKNNLEQQRPDVVHTHQIGALFYAGPAARKLEVPVVVHTEHGKHFERGVRIRVLGRWAARSAQQFFCVSNDIAHAVKTWRIAPDEKVAVVANGITTARPGGQSDNSALRRELGIPHGAAVIGTVSRLAEVKRQDVLLAGFSKIRTAAIPPHLVLVGGGPLESNLRNLAGQLGIAERVHFAGFQKNPEQYVQIMDVFALTSRSEGMPLSVLEAWAAGVPVVASRVGGLPELIQDGRTGALFDFGDTDALAHLFESLIGGSPRARQMAAAGQEYVRSRFDVSVMAANYQQQYERLLEGAAC